MTKPHARGATRGEEGRISFSGSGAKTPEGPSEPQEAGPISGSPFECPIPTVIGHRGPRRFRGDSEDARAGVPSRTNCSRPFLASMSSNYGHGVTTFGMWVMTWPHLGGIMGHRRIDPRSPPSPGGQLDRPGDRRAVHRRPCRRAPARARAPVASHVHGGSGRHVNNGHAAAFVSAKPCGHLDRGCDACGFSPGRTFTSSPPRSRAHADGAVSRVSRAGHRTGRILETAPTRAGMGSPKRRGFGTDADRAAGLMVGISRGADAFKAPPPL